MPALDSPAVIVARFLKANHYDDTLQAFLVEAELPPDAGITSKGDLTLEKILEEKQQFDLALRVEKLGIEDKEKNWTLPAPTFPLQISTVPSTANLLHVSIEKFEDTSRDPRQVIIATTADRQLHTIAPDRTFSLVKSLTHLHDSPILTCVPFGGQKVVTVSCGMSGQTILYDHESERILDERRDHKKYVIRATTCEEDGQVQWTATAGWDSKVFLYRTSGEARLGAPIASISLQTVPESIIFVTHPTSRRPLLLVTRRDSTSLHYYQIPSTDTTSELSTTVPELKLLGSQNLAPHSNSWIVFSPSSVALCPVDPTLLAVATSTVPHMKLILVRLLVPAISQSSTPVPRSATQVAQSRENLVLQNREEAAILVNISTLAPQTPYSTPAVVWRPNGSGVWVNGDDGVLRGIEAHTGKIISTLKDGHEPGSKIRSIWCGNVTVDDTVEEWIVSGGFDHRLIVWKPEQ